MKNLKLNTKKELLGFLAALYEAVPDVILTTDTYGIIQICNKSSVRTFGYQPNELIGLNISVLIGSPHKEEYERKIKDYLKTGCSAELKVSRRIEGRNIDGFSFPMSLTVAEVVHNGVGFFTYVIRDIRQIINTELELEKRTQELARSNMDLQNFAAIAAHDLQAPLRTIRTHAESLNSNKNITLNAEATDKLNRIANASRRMRHLIDGLLELSQITNCKPTFRTVTFNEVIDELINDLATAITEAEATIIRADLPIILGDKNLIRQLLQNLLTNSLKFKQPNTKPHIQVEAKLDGKQCTISVSDNGIGIDPKHHASIFETFRRLHSNHEFPGSGIGLSICRKIVEHHGGKIWVQAKPTEGTCFSFTLPVPNY